MAINEAIELAKLFGSESLPRFVNGVLGSAVAAEKQANPLIAYTPAARWHQRNRVEEGHQAWLRAQRIG